MKEVTSL